jgi:sugar lactone lactonase YvrE
MGVLDALGLTESDWVHVDPAVTRATLGDACLAVARWDRTTLASVERLHRLDRELRDLDASAVALGVHVDEPPNRDRPDRVLASLLAHGTFAPTAIHDHPPQTHGRPGAIFLVTPEGTLDGVHDAASDLDAIVERASQLAGEASDGPRTRRSQALGPDTLAAPQDVDAEGSRLAIADTGHNRVLVTAGASTRAIGDGARGHRDGSAGRARFRAPMGVALAGDTLWVADTGNHAIRRVDLDADHVETVVQDAGTHPAGIAADDETVVWVRPESGRVHVLDGGTLGEGLEAPVDVALDEGEVLVADREAGEITRVDLDAGSTRPVPASSTLVAPEGLAVADRLLAADPEVGRLVDLGSGKGRPVDVGSGPPLVSPTGVTGALVVTDEADPRLARTTDGTLQRVPVAEPAVDADEHVSLDPIEIAPRGEIVVHARLRHAADSAQATPPRISGPVTPGGGRTEIDEHLTGTRRARVEASGRARIDWVVESPNGRRATAWTVPIVVRAGAPPEACLELLPRTN